MTAVILGYNKAIVIIKNVFGNNPLFSSLPPEEIERLGSAFIEEKHGKESVIFQEGEPCVHLCLVERGKVKIVKHSPAGKDTIVELIGEGEMFGAVALMSGKPLPGSAVAAEETLVAKLPKKEFDALLARHPSMLAPFMETISKRVTRAHESLKNLAHDKVEVRLAKALLKLQKKALPDSQKEIKTTRKELAETVGTSVETAIRVLSRFQKEGLIDSPKRGWIRVLKSEKLEEISEG